jgi:signal transduction histidine kinase
MLIKGSPPEKRERQEKANAGFTRAFRRAILFSIVKDLLSGIGKMEVLPVVRRLRPGGFRQQLLSYTLILILFVMAAALVFFSLTFTMFEQVQEQTNVYITINELTAGLMESRAAFDEIITRQPSAVAAVAPPGYTARQAVENHAAVETKLLADLEQLAVPYTEAAREQYFLYNGIGNGLVYISQIRDALAQKSSYTPDDYAAYYSVMTVYNYLIDYVCNRYLSATIKTNARILAHIRQEAQRLRFWGLGVLAFIVICSVFIVRRITTRLIRPINAMVRTAGEITRGNLNTPDIPLSGPDELVFLERSVNQMKTSLREWMQAIARNAELEKQLHQRELEKARSKRELDQARFRLLQAQINPHFLFNTLNTISRTALFEHADTSVDLIEKLSQIFRYTLEYRDDVRLGEELQFVGRYLAIQKARFGDRVRFSISCPDELLDLRMPSLIIQPFVENAIIHGLEPLEEGGEVLVRVSPEDGRIVIAVSDTGVGMDGAADSASAPKNSGHIGMKNVRERIRLYYRGLARISVGPGPAGRGTSVRILLPRPQKSSSSAKKKTEYAG